MAPKLPSRKRFPEGSVCKPCWELKYCPYGPLVELFPGPGTKRTPSQVRADYETALLPPTAGTKMSEEEVWEAIERLHYLQPWMTEQIRGNPSDEVGCKIFGHACPVFFVQSGATETKEGRRQGRTIPRDVMLKVVRRDDHICQVCYQYVPDTEVEFDHVIPYSKGGPTTAENVRLLCRTCNRKKGIKLEGLID